MKLTIIGLVGLTVGLYAGRPLVTDDAYPVEQGSVEVEAGIELETTTNSYGTDRPVQLRIRGHRLAGTRDQAEACSTRMIRRPHPRRARGVGDLVLEAKALLPFRPFDLDLALVPSLKIPTASASRSLGTGQSRGSAKIRAKFRLMTSNSLI